MEQQEVGNGLSGPKKEESKVFPEKREVEKKGVGPEKERRRERKAVSKVKGTVEQEKGEESVKNPDTQENTTERLKKVNSGFCHDGKMQPCLSQKHPGKIGLYVDCDRGRLSSFSVSGARVKLFHRFEKVSSNPSHPAVWLREPEIRMTFR